MIADMPDTTGHPDPHKNRILILDFGAQYTQLIARSIRELGVYCEIYSWDAAFDAVARFNPNGLILSGGPASAYHHQTHLAPPEIFAMGRPILGICYGMQTMVAQLGGAVENCKTHFRMVKNVV